MEPIEKVSVMDMVVKNLKELITSGRIPIGGKLPTEKELCEQLHVGRSTVREAIRMLQAMGFVTMKPGRGAFVAKIREEDPESIVSWFTENEVQLTDFLEARMAIENLAVKLAILRATDKEVQNIEKAHTSFEEAVLNEDYDKLGYYDEVFHSSIIKATHNNLMITIDKNISDAFRTFRMKSFTVKSSATSALKPHREIMNAIRNRDVEKGVQAMNNHINQAIKDMIRIIITKDVNHSDQVI